MSHENLSAMLDGECSDEEIRLLLEATSGSPELAEKWSRLCLAREVISGRPNLGRASPGFCAGVMARLSEPEPSTVVAFPRPVRPAVPSVAPAQRRSSRFRRDVARPLVGLAAAATLAFVAVATGRSFFGHLESGQPLSAVAAAPSDVQQVASEAAAPTARSGLVQVSNRATSPEEPAETGWAQLNPEAARELNGYLAQHNGFGADQGVGGPLGAARMAVRTVEYRSAVDGSR